MYVCVAGEEKEGDRQNETEKSGGGREEGRKERKKMVTTGESRLRECGVLILQIFWAHSSALITIPLTLLNTQKNPNSFFSLSS